MRIDCIAVGQHMDPEMAKGKTVVVIDVLRASSVIVTALAHGAKGVVPVSKAEEAFLHKAPDVLLCGEQYAKKIAGFDKGNSPDEYTPEVVHEKTMVLCTTNGTKAILASRKASTLLIGSFLNGQAIAEEVLKRGNDLLLVCSGTNGDYSLDDVVCAGMIASSIVECKACGLSDETLAAKVLYENYKTDLHKLLSQCKHYAVLRKKGFMDDVNYCLQQNVHAIVPLYEGGKILK